MNWKALLTKFVPQKKKKIKEEPLFVEPKPEPIPEPVPEPVAEKPKKVPKAASYQLPVLTDESTELEVFKRFTEEEKLHLCKMVAEFKRPFEIQRYVSEAWGKEVPHQTITYYFKAQRWAAIIERFRAEYLAGVMEVPIANRKVRLERLEDIFDQTERDQGLVAAERRQQKLAVLKHAREEMEEKQSVSNTFNTQIINLSDEELHKRKQQILASMKTIPTPTLLDKPTSPVELNEIAEVIDERKDK